MADFLSIHTGQEVDDAVKSAKSGNTGSHPILYNTGHSAVYFPVNQRAFDGNWAALSIGDYGYDGWLKYSATHKAQIIELGEFEDIEYTISYDGVVVGLIQPPSGIASNWLVAVPFAVDRIDLKPGDGYGRWQAEEYGQKLAKAQRYYYSLSGVSNWLAAYMGSSSDSAVRYFAYVYPSEMRVAPSVAATFFNQSGGLSYADTRQGTRITVTATSNGANVFINTLTASASFTIADAGANITIT